MNRGRPIAAGGRSAQAASAKALLAVLGRPPVAFAQGKDSTFTFSLPVRQ